MLKKMYNIMKRNTWAAFRVHKCKKDRRNLKSQDFTILSQNCIGGVLYNDLGCRFLSPTINMYFTFEDMIKFCENIKDYILLEPVECESNYEFPVMMLGDLKLHMVHYRTFEDAKEKWNERKRRINFDNICVIMTDRSGYSDEYVCRYNKLPYKKIMFVNSEDRHIVKDQFLIHGYENEKFVGVLSDPIGWFGRRNMDAYDFVEFLNSKST
ncbi:MAG: DUF1919 domain-containing protein [Bacillota bacterium]